MIQYAEDNGIPFKTFESLAQSSQVQELLDSEIRKVNNELEKAQRVKKFSVLSGRLFDEGEQTPQTPKMKREYLSERFADLINAMYAD